MFKNENLKRALSNWGQLVLFNKKITNSFCKYFIDWFTNNKKPLEYKECNEISHFLVHLAKYLFFF